MLGRARSDLCRLAALCFISTALLACVETIRHSVDDNVAPVANAGDDQTLAYEGEPVTVTLDGSESEDQDGRIVKYTWKNAALIDRYHLNGDDDDGGTAEAGDDDPRPDGSMAVADASTVGDGAVNALDPVNSDGGAADAGHPDRPMGEPGPDPDDVVRPEVKLNRGVYTFLLWVTDDDGVTSAPDTVVIAVGEPSSSPEAECADSAYEGLTDACRQCTCTQCPDEAVACGQICWQLLACIVEECAGEDMSCAMNAFGAACAEFGDGAEAALAISDCVRECADDCG